MSKVLDDEPENVDLSFDGAVLVGWVCTRLHPEDHMGEVYVLAVDPEFQCRGIGAELISHSFSRARAAGMRMMMVETGDDPGHAPSRGAFEASGFQRGPVARYFKDLF